MTMKLIGCPKAAVVLFSKLSFIFSCFINSFESRRGISLGMMLTCILVLVVPMVKSIVAPLMAVTCAPSILSLYWLSLFVFNVSLHNWDFLGRYWTKILQILFYLLCNWEQLYFCIPQQWTGVLVDGCNQFGIYNFVVIGVILTLVIRTVGSSVVYRFTDWTVCNGMIIVSRIFTFSVVCDLLFWGAFVWVLLWSSLWVVGWIPELFLLMWLRRSV